MIDLDYVGLDSSIGCMVNGASIAMATVDIGKLDGGAPTTLLDVGGRVSEGEAVKLIQAADGRPAGTDDALNIFGGIMECGVSASGIVKEVNLKVPLVARLEGTNVEEGKRILRESTMDSIAVDSRDVAASKGVDAISA